MISLDLTTIGILPAFKVIAVAWDVDLIATAPSWMSEMAVNFNRVNYLAPGYQVQGPGGPTSFYGDFFVFSSIGLGDVFVTDGILNLEFFEFSDDYPTGVDGLWLAGSTLTFRLDATPNNVSAAPEPSTIGMSLSGLVAIGGYGAWRRAGRASAA